jgi:peptidoglycan/LPS O-acetylase OafA/YrhL
MNSSTTTSLYFLAITVFIVFRFARRELRARTIKIATLWIRPALLVAITAYLIYLSASLDPLGDGEMFAVLAGGGVLGIIVGLAIVRNTHFAPAAVRNAVVVTGNKITFGIWIAALAVRLLARYVLPRGADPAAQLPLNCGTVVMTAVAFVVIAIAFWIEIRRYAGVSGVTSMGEPASMVPGTTTRQ